MARSKSTRITKPFQDLVSRETVEAEGQRLGVIQRQRKVDLFALVWTLVLGFQIGARRTITALRETYEAKAGHTIVRSAFYRRLNARLAKLLHGLAIRAMDELGTALRLSEGALAGFSDLLALDSMVLRLHKLLVGPYPACRTNHTQAAAKLHVVMSVLDGSPRRVKLTSERTSDTTPWKRVGKWLRGCLLLFDLGYYSFQLFDRVDQNGGYFLSRLKKNANLRIVACHRKWRGRSIDVIGKRLQDILPLLGRKILDVQVEVTFKKRGYRCVHRKKTRTFRLVAVRNDETGSYHCYLTNVPPERLAAEEVTQTYALRWQVELLFKSMSTHGHLRHLPSAKRAVVECLIWASVLATLASQALYRLVRRHVESARHIPLLRWASLFSRHAATLLHLIVRPNRSCASELLDLLIHEAPDPNRNRPARALPIAPCLMGS